jgi:hypothetical protein
MPADPDSVDARPHPTPYPDVNVVLGHFRASIENILAPHFLGMYLSGSLALGDFAPHRSDIDFVVMTDAELPADLFSSLRAMHARFNAGDSPWATEVEAVYIAREALRRHDPRHAVWPHIQRGNSNVLERDLLDSGWVIQRHILREHGVVVAGPALREVIDPVQPREMRQAVVALLDEWWGPMRNDPAPLRHRGYQAYAVLTMCRMLYTFEFGAVVSKPVAARWAHEELDDRWPGLIERSLAWEKDRPITPTGDVDQTLGLIHYTVERCGNGRA